ncbi:MAG: hypothetical protein FJ137_21840 [Deltaproteobacteria bacterium]|nr:hypothetical protein [Deltaproteobacteria bacterium]
MSIDVTTSAANDTARGLRRVLLVTLALNIAVATAKVVVGTLAGSSSIRAHGFHSSTDGLNNVNPLLATTCATRSPAGSTCTCT